MRVTLKQNVDVNVRTAYEACSVPGNLGTNSTFPIRQEKTSENLMEMGERGERA
jgi:hypothetical protein